MMIVIIMVIVMMIIRILVIVVIMIMIIIMMITVIIGCVPLRFSSRSPWAACRGRRGLLSQSTNNKQHR